MSIENEPMPWCEYCQCYHHDTAPHIHKEKPTPMTLNLQDDEITITLRDEPMKALEPFMITQAQKTLCSICENNVTLLMAKEPTVGIDPAFYICWTCRDVRQIGVGLVEVEP